MHLSWAMSFATKEYYYKKPGRVERMQAIHQRKQQDTRKRHKANKGTKREQYHP